MLTQVGDTPLMWIARGMLLEKSAKQGDEIEEKLHSASDAYRACLQTTRYPSALLGLALTCRRLGLNSCEDDYKLRSEEIARKESEANLAMYLHSSDDKDKMLEFIHGVTVDEKGKDNNKSFVSEVLRSTGMLNTANFAADDIEVQKQTIDQAQKRVRQNPDDGESWLNLAKLLILSFTKVKDPSKQSCDLIVDVVERAKYILKAAVTEPGMLHPTGVSTNAHKSVVSSLVNASQLSDAHVLSSWVCENNKLTCSHDLQRALLLDPENRFARGMLQK